MTRAARFLHITDTHLKPGGSAFEIDDRKRDIQLEPQTREGSLEGGLERLAERLTQDNQRLDGVIFSGDALSGGKAGGDKLLLDLILRHLGPHGITAQCIVAVPGNHDVPQGAEPGSDARYKEFLEAWRAAGCITPWLDGIDLPKPDFANHILLGPDNAWAIIAVNSSNWSHVNAIPPKLASMWDRIPATLAPGDSDLEAALRKELNMLARYDVARVSPNQLDALRWMLKSLPRADHGKQLRMMVLHHHLRAPSVAEEVKPFADISNLEQIRTFIAEQNIRVVLHGHKHVGRVHSDVVEPGLGRPPHKVLMVAGASFSASDHADAMRILDLTGLPWVPSLGVEPLAIPRGGLDPAPAPASSSRLWAATDSAAEAPVVIQGSNFDEVYARVILAAREEAKDKTLIVQLDLSDFTAVKRLPDDYPSNITAGAERAAWLKDLVDWWQLPQSQLQERVPYIHGTRLRNYGSNLDQIDRVRTLLKDRQTTRAIALLVDPSVDFKEASGAKNDFASFCLVQFTRRDEPGAVFIDCVGYYRAQEMVKWWPINVAELLDLQTQVGKPFNGRPGRITTITACARSLARSPTHVAMPVIDRWLDQTPEKYFVLASILLSDAPMPANARKVLREWVAALDELNEAATIPTPDGGPVVAIEGPIRLAKYLRIGNGPRADECARLAENLEEIARIGKSPPPSSEVLQRHTWGVQLSRLLGRAAEQCRALEIKS
ncbi:metallophosphoesterase [Variovorax sp. AFSI2.2]|uniref:metallophosphoesterase n=1 Tax=Variovorax sp. AFSI2.2 TaxID=3384160 RepID=UPI003EBDDDCD